jgi:hypothetical protein
MIRLLFSLSTALVLLLPAAGVSAQSLCHVVHLSVYRVDVSPSQKIVDVEPFTTRLLNYGGTFDPGFYAVSVEVGAGAPGAPVGEARYCNISANVDFEMDSPGIVPDPMDTTIAIVRARVSGWQFPIVTQQVDSLVGGGFDAQAAQTESLNQQYAVALSRHSSMFTGGGFTIDAGVRTYGVNDFMAGFPEPSGFGSAKIERRFRTTNTTDWSLSGEMTVDEGPGTGPSTVARMPSTVVGGPGEAVLSYVGVPDASFVLAPLASPPILELEVIDPDLVLAVTALPSEPDVSGYRVAYPGGPLGVFASGAPVDFVALTGGGVPRFSVEPLDLVGSDPQAFVFGLDLDVPSSTIVIRVPEPGAGVVGITALITLGLLLPSRSRVAEPMA